ncbi:MAG: hypothetical protein SF028_05460 [Candidatus Sumerlaeia bacterium]|nr:hypothetical protein [Candidatus Sumerlaeia bacterium]
MEPFAAAILTGFLMSSGAPWTFAVAELPANDQRLAAEGSASVPAGHVYEYAVDHGFARDSSGEPLAVKRTLKVTRTDRDLIVRSTQISASSDPANARVAPTHEYFLYRDGSMIGNLAGGVYTPFPKNLGLGDFIPPFSVLGSEMPGAERIVFPGESPRFDPDRALAFTVAEEADSTVYLIKGESTVEREGFKTYRASFERRSPTHGTVTASGWGVGILWDGGNGITFLPYTVMEASDSDPTAPGFELVVRSFSPDVGIASVRDGDELRARLDGYIAPEKSRTTYRLTEYRPVDPDKDVVSVEQVAEKAWSVKTDSKQRRSVPAFVESKSGDLVRVLAFDAETLEFVPAK